MHLVVRTDSVWIPFRLAGKLVRQRCHDTPPIQVLASLPLICTARQDLVDTQLCCPRQDLVGDRTLSKLQQPLAPQRI